MAEAERIAGRLTDRDAQDSAGLLMRAELSLLKGKLEDAGKTLAQLRRRDADNLDVEVLSIRMVMARGKAASGTARGPKGISQAGRDALIARLRKVLSARPVDVEVTRLMAKLLTDSGKGVQADILWGDLYRKRRGDVAVALKYVNVLVRSRKHSQAADVLAGVVADDPENVSLRSTLADLLLRAKRYDQAAHHGEILLREALDPDKAGHVRWLLLKAYTETEAFDKAQSLLDDWILSIGDDKMLLWLRREKIVLYGKARQLDRAEEYALAWIRQSPRLLMPRSALVGATSL